MPQGFGNSQDLVVIKEIRDNTVILKDDSIRQVLMVSGINFALKSETEQEIITTSYQNFLNSIDFPLQVVIHSRKINIEKYLTSLAEFTEKEASPLLKSQGEEYQEFIRGFVQKNAIMEKTFLLVVPFTPISVPSINTISNYVPFLKKSKDKAQNEAEDLSFEESVAQLKQRVGQIVEGLSVVGLNSIVLEKTQLIELFYNFYNPETTERENISIPQT